MSQNAHVGYSERPSSQTMDQDWWLIWQERKTCLWMTCTWWVSFLTYFFLCLQTKCYHVVKLLVLSMSNRDEWPRSWKPFIFRYICECGEKLPQEYTLWCLPRLFLSWDFSGQVLTCKCEDELILSCLPDNYQNSLYVFLMSESFSLSLVLMSFWDELLLWEKSFARRRP